MGLTMKERQSLFAEDRIQISEGKQEVQGNDSRRVRAINRLSPDLRKFPAEPSREASGDCAKDEHCRRHPEAGS